MTRPKKPDPDQPDPAGKKISSPCTQNILPDFSKNFLENFPGKPGLGVSDPPFYLKLLEVKASQGVQITG
jgi:hypothetical protein